MGEPAAYLRLLTVFWSRVYQQRHVTHMPDEVGERNVAIIGIDFAFWLCNMNVILC